MNDLLKVLSELPTLVLEWLDVVKNPVAFFDKVVSGPDDKRRIAIRLWGVSFVITFLLTIPVFKAGANIEWNTMGYHLSYMTLLLVTFLAGGACLHGALRLRGVPSAFDVTLLAYSIAWSPISVFAGIVTLPTWFLIFQCLRDVKAGKPFFEAYWARVAEPSYLTYYLHIANALQMLILSIFVLVLARLISRAYSVPKTRSILTTTFAMTVAGFPAMILGLGFWLVLYAFVT